MCRFLLPAALVAAAAFALAGCGGSGPSRGSTTAASAVPTPQAKSAVADATAKTAAASARVEVQVLLRKPGGSPGVSYNAYGNVVPQGGKLDIDRRPIGGDIQHEIFLRDGGGLTLYTSPSPVKLPKGKTWLKVNMTEYGVRRYGVDTTFFAGADQDPLQPLKLLQSPVAKVKDLGQDWLPDRTLNTHYQGTVSLIAAARAAGVKAKGIRQVESDMGKPTQTIDVWVSKAGEVARVVVHGPQLAPDGTTLQLKETTDFTKYGAKATIKAPPAAKTADYFSLSSK
jgi:hypothetical protein